MSVILKLLITAGVIFVIANYGLIPGISVANFALALLVAFLLGAVNVIIRPIILLFTLPINILTFGLFTFVINAFLLWGTAAIVDGFEVESFTAAFLGAFVISVTHSIVDRII